MTRYFATCARGLEPVLARELVGLQAGNVQPGRGGVSFAGDRELLYRANLWLRTAVRVLRPVLEAEILTSDDLYQAVQSVDWTEHLTAEHTFAVDCNVKDSAITHSHYAALRTKDAICDQLLQRWGRRPNIDVQNPMLPLNLHIYRNKLVLSLDSSGDSLHKRGYRPIQTRAPLNEALAAGILMLADWMPELPLADPMCGSGTFLIEGCWMALHRPPGLTRKRFGFMGWLDFDISLWTELRDAARSHIGKTLPAPIAGSDLRHDAVEFARKNARAAGVGHLIDLKTKDISSFRPPGSPPGVIIVNPPYGERLGGSEEIGRTYEKLATALRQHCRGYSAWILSGNPLLEEVMAIDPRCSIPLYNGPIRCRLLSYDLA